MKNRIDAATVMSAVMVLFVLGAAGGAQASETLKVTFTTSAPIGVAKYGTKNVHAVWIEDSKGAFIKTIARWAKDQKRQLTDWKKADGTDTDGMTGATQKNYGAYTAEWDLRGRDGKPVPNGIYKIQMELTNNDAKKDQRHRATVTFNKNGVSSTQEVASQSGYSNIKIQYKSE
ncbi:MAG: DUF2271 domain-containing protein [Candidatus Sumerlaeota bacterium]|nr:DUF2271 domain-containing protein [Candidatus Sumerlaeota bacterium]